MPRNKKEWRNAWTLDTSAGTATHAPTGLRVSFAAQRHGRITANLPADAVQIDTCRVPAHVTERRDAAAVSPDAPNGYGVSAWAVHVPAQGSGSLHAVHAALAQRMGKSDADAALRRLLREAVDLWLYRVKMDRERPKILDTK